MPRVNLYLSDEEADYITDATTKLGVTRAYIVRLILRDFIGLPVGGEGRSELRYLTEINSVHVQNLTPDR